MYPGEGRQGLDDIPQGAYEGCFGKSDRKTGKGSKPEGSHGDQVPELEGVLSFYRLSAG